MLRIGLLGATELSDEGTVLPVPPPMPRALLALLALRPGSPVTVDAIMDALWGDAPPDTARNAIQVYVSALRRALGRDAIRSGPAGYLLDRAIRVDAVEFEAAIREQRRAPAGPDVAVAAWRSALALWRGEPLADVTAPFVDTQRARLVELRLAVVDAWVEAQFRADRHGETVLDLQGLVAQYPLREQLWARLITALGRAGRQADALDAYQRIRTLLREELGADPGEALRLAYRDVLQPARQAPPLTPLAHVPAPRTALIGRDRDVARVRALLATPGIRLVTVVGPAGVGKTRLVLEVIRAETEAAQSRPGETAWVPLAGLTDAAMLLPALARGLGVRERPGQDVAAAVTAALRPRTLLLVLDNIEQLLPGAASGLAAMLDDCPRLTVLVTSRVATRITGEHRLLLDPLPVGAGSGFGVENAATALLVERAHAIRPGWATRPEALACADGLAADLDGLPLALELAAARATLLGPCALRERLRGRLTSLEARMVDIAPRHRSLEAALTWSYDLLPAPARRVFAQLAVFRGTITLDAAIAVTELDEETALDRLTVLTDASLLQLTDQDSPTFGMLETIRAFAEHQLAASDDVAAVCNRHAQFFAGLARSAEPHLWGADQQRWLDVIEHNHDNLRAALRHFMIAGRSEAGLDLAASLAAFWEARGNAWEALAFLRDTLNRLPSADPALRAKAMFFASRLAAQQCERAEEWVLLESSLALYRQVGDVHGETFVLSHMGVASARQGRAALAAEVGSRSVALAQSDGDRWHIAMALNNHGYARVMLGEVGAQTQALLTESLRLRRELREKRGVAVTLGSLAELHLLRHDYDEAGAQLDEMRTLAVELAHAELICVALNLSATRHVALDAAPLAKSQLQESLRLSYPRGYWELVGEVLLQMAAVAVLDEFPARALRLAVVAQRVLTSGGGVLTALQRRTGDHVLGRVEQALGDATRTAVQTAAQTSTVDQAVAEALASSE